MAIRQRTGAGARGLLTDGCHTVTTPRGPARVDLDLPPAGPASTRTSRPVAAPRSLLVLGHGAGGGVDAVDLLAVRDALLPAGVAVARLTQPYRVAGRRAPAPAGHLDEAFIAVVTALRAELPGPPLVVGGRSSGARVACRTAARLDAAGVLALAFPLHPPGKPEKSRLPELDTGLPTLVVNGDRDPFGVPPAAPGVRVEVRAGERHALDRVPGAVAELARGFFVDQGWADSPP